MKYVVKPRGATLATKISCKMNQETKGENKLKYIHEPHKCEWCFPRILIGQLGGEQQVLFTSTSVKNCQLYTERCVGKQQLIEYPINLFICYKRDGTKTANITKLEDIWTTIALKLVFRCCFCQSYWIMNRVKDINVVLSNYGFNVSVLYFVN